MKMSPSITNEDISLTEEEQKIEKLVDPRAGPRKYTVSYIRVFGFLYFHLAALYGLYLCFTSVKWTTIIFSCGTFYLSVLGITAGAHRLWSHKTYKAKMPLQIFLMLCQSLASQYSVLNWVRDHRLHHKYSDTNADPHNASRGFFFSHIGWLVVHKHPEVKRRSKFIDISDIHSNPVLMFQNRHAVWFITTVAFVIPTIVPMYFWNETLSNSWHSNVLRFVIVLNITFLVNSLAHMWGNKPYDKTIAPSQSLPIIFVTFGEGYHNYHHVFPWDYRTAELGCKINVITRFIDFCAWLGLAYDRKYPSSNIVQARAQRTGDGTYL